ncbi:MAG: response regulator transcription factor, partial [Moheibacter sp.]
MKHKVTIVDDHTLLSQAIGNLVDGLDDFETDGIFKNGQEVVDALKGKRITPKIILMDVRMPVMDGIEATRIITKTYPKILVLALSVETEERTIIQMLKAGAKGFLSKD